MISVCPNCHSHFKVSVSLLGEEGRTVRCSVCENTWFQDPIPDDDDLREIEALEQKNAPQAEFDSPDQEEDDDGMFDLLMRDSGSDDEVNIPSRFVEQLDQRRSRVTSAVFVLILFVLTLMYGVLNREAIKQSWPESRVLYASLGLDESNFADGVLFDALQASYDGYVLRVSGNLINLNAGVVKLPHMKVDFLDGSDAVVGSAPIMSDKHVLDAEEIFAFDHALNFQRDLDDVDMLRVGFSLAALSDLNAVDTSKIGGAGGDNIQAPHAGGSDH